MIGTGLKERGMTLRNGGVNDKKNGHVKKKGTALHSGSRGILGGTENWKHATPYLWGGGEASSWDHSEEKESNVGFLRETNSVR